jgi:transposase
MEKEEVLPTYYTRQSIEQIFGFAKSSNNLLPLRVHTEQSISGYLMLVFLSVIIFVLMRQKLQPVFTVENALLTLRGLKAKVYDKELIILEPNKKAKDIIKLLDIIMPTSLGI